MEHELLVAVEDPGDVDRDAELGENLELHPPSRDRQECQRRDQLGIAGVGGVGLVVVRRVVVFHRERELPDLLASDLEVVRRAVMAADDVLGLYGEGHALCSLLEYVLSGAAYQRDWRRDANAASAPPAAPSARADGTPIRAALRAVRKSRISHPRSRASARRRASGLMATAVPTNDNMGTSL